MSKLTDIILDTIQNLPSTPLSDMERVKTIGLDLYSKFGNLEDAYKAATKRYVLVPVVRGALVGALFGAPFLGMAIDVGQYYAQAKISNLK